MSEITIEAVGFGKEGHSALSALENRIRSSNLKEARCPNCQKRLKLSVHRGGIHTASCSDSCFKISSLYFSTLANLIEKLEAIPSHICGLCYHDKSTAENCSRPDCEAKGVGA